MKAKLEKEINTYSESLHTSVDEPQVLKIMDWCSAQEKNKAVKTKERQKHKFEGLRSTNQPQQLDPQRLSKTSAAG